MPLDWDHWRVRLVSGSRHHCEPGWRLAPGWAAQRIVDFDFWFVFKGAGWMRFKDQRVTLRPGVCFWMRPGGEYVSEQDPDDRLGVVAVHFLLVDPTGKTHADAQSVHAAKRGRLPGERLEVSDVAYADGVLRRVLALRLDRRPSSLDVVESLLRGLLMDVDTSSTHGGEPTGTARHHRDVAIRAAARIAENPAEAPTIAEQARQAGYSADHFARVFREHVGVSPRDYAVRARIDRARELLVESDHPVGTIAQMLGYQDVYFFSRQFKQKVGVSPLPYRRGERG